MFIPLTKETMTLKQVFDEMDAQLRDLRVEGTPDQIVQEIDEDSVKFVSFLYRMMRQANARAEERSI